MTKIKRIWKSVKDFCIAIDPFIVSFFMELSKYARWIIGVLLATALLLMFSNRYYDKGLKIGDAIFTTILDYLLSVSVSVPIGILLMFLLLLTTAIIVYLITGKKLKISPADRTDDTGRTNAFEQAPSETSEKNNPLPAIDEERLGRYFKASFKRKGNIDQFRILLDLLEVERTVSSTNVGKVALLLFESPIMADTKPHAFSKWIVIFFESLGLRCPKDKSKNKYRCDMSNDKDARLKSKYQYFL